MDTTVAANPSEQQDPQVYPGLNRLTYFGCNLLFAFVLLFVVAAMGSAVADALWLNLMAIAVSLAFGSQRFRNLGSHPAWSLLLIVPVANLVVSIYLTCFPPGYARHRTLDGVGKVLLVILLAMIVLPLLALFLAAP